MHDGKGEKQECSVVLLFVRRLGGVFFRFAFIAGTVLAAAGFFLFAAGLLFFAGGVFLCLGAKDEGGQGKSSEKGENTEYIFHLLGRFKNTTSQTMRC